ncbi:MAG: TraR/DksA family transcriptional regulator [Alcanivorax sp.]|uniref:TraR/DksA family transcriptional regulator n=1 Tax=Alcanivorax sp. TaxID=1872427 RepID=UPI003DA73179
MEQAEQEHFHRKLLDEKQALSEQNDAADSATKPVELDQQSVGRLSRMDAMQGQAMALATRQRQEQRLRQLVAALRRIDENDYGYCEDCGKPINPRRLEIDPATLFCLACATARE